MNQPAETPRKRRRGPTPKSAQELRTHCVSVRLNDGELEQLNVMRGRIQRGEWLRLAAFGNLPKSIPAINTEAWASLARVAANLNQAQSAVNSGKASGYPPEIFDELRAQVAELRMLLIGGGK